MSYQSWSVVYGEQPSAAKWNILGTNDSSFNDGSGLNSGAIRQIVYTETGAVATGTTGIPPDDTIPQNTEGDQYMSLAITPKDSASTLTIDIQGIFAASSATSLWGALFQDSTASALASSGIEMTEIGRPKILTLTHTMTAGTTSATTFKFRVGKSAGDAGTITFNGSGGTRQMGGSFASSIIIREYHA